MIKINVAEIQKKLVGEKHLRFELSAQELDITPQELRLLGPVQMEGTMSNVGDVLLLRAELEASVECVCGRCLKVFSTATSADVLEKYYPRASANPEEDAFVYDSDVIDITEPLRESLLLAEPIQALCKQDCRGLCPVCGADLNDGDCGCDRFTVDPRLAALKQFIKH